MTVCLIILSFVQDKEDNYGNINTGYLPVVINIRDLDDRSPVFNQSSYSAHVEEGYRGLVKVLPEKIFAKDGDTLNTPVFYELGKINTTDIIKIRITLNICRFRNTFSYQISLKYIPLPMCYISKPLPSPNRAA